VRGGGGTDGTNGTYATHGAQAQLKPRSQLTNPAHCSVSNLDRYEGLALEFAEFTDLGPEGVAAKIPVSAA
jgi:hypothetical protein